MFFLTLDKNKIDRKYIYHQIYKGIKKQILTGKLLSDEKGLYKTSRIIRELEL